jgi:hemolysin activation/secretion protein
MGELEIQKHKYFNNERLRYYWKIKPGEVLRYDKIGTALQAMGRNPDREVKSILRAGKKPGTTDVVLAAETSFPLHAFATFDNDGVTSSGTSRSNYGLRDNNFLGFDDSLIVGYTQGIHFRGKYFYHNVPLGPNNTFLTYGYSDSHSAPKQEYSSSGISSDAVTTTFSLHQEFFSPDAYIGEVFGGFDTNDKVIRTNDGVYNKDRLRIASVGGTYIYRGSESNTVLSSQFYQGLYGFGASPKDNPLSSRGGQAHAGFSKTNFSIDHLRALPLNLQAKLRYRQQISSDPLSPQQEFNLGGMDSVRGYPAADFLADNAQVCNLELISPAFFIPEGWRIPYAEDNIKNQTSLVGFLDYGHGDRKGTMSGDEKKSVNYMGVGAGLRFKLFNQVSLRLEWGVNVGDKPITESGKTHFHFAVNFQEQTPEEIARIKKIIEADNIKKWSQQLINLELSQPDSPVRVKLYDYFLAADSAYKKGRFQDSKDSYQKAIQLSRSLMMQAEDYVRKYVSLSKEMENKIQLADEYNKQGRMNQARILLAEVAGSAQLLPANLEY